MLFIDAADELHSDDLHRLTSFELELYVKDYELFAQGFAATSELLGEFTQIGQNLAQLDVSNAEATVKLVNDKYTQTVETSQSRRKEIESLAAKLKDDEHLCKQFADLAENFISFIEIQKDKASKATGDNIDEAVKTLEDILQVLESNGSGKLQELEQIDEQINSRNVENNETTYSLRQLKTAYDSFFGTATKRLEAARKQAEANQQTGITPEEYADIKESFEHFDKDNDGKLNPLDFFGVLKFLGEEATEDSARQLLLSLDGDHDGLLSFDEYKDYMISKKSDKDTMENYAESFGQIAGGKEFITEDDLRRSGMPTERIGYLLSSMQVREDIQNVVAYDYKGWLSRTHGQ
jgi:actinin alpha